MATESENKRSLSHFFKNLDAEASTSRSRSRKQVTRLEQETNATRTTRTTKAQPQKKHVEKDISDSENEEDEMEIDVEDKENVKPIQNKTRREPVIRKTRELPKRGQKKPEPESSESESEESDSEEEEESEDEDDIVPVRAKKNDANPDATKLIEHVLGAKQAEQDANSESDQTEAKKPELLYLVKEKSKSYIHARWLSRAQMETEYKNTKTKLTKFHSEGFDAEDIDEQTSYFNPDYCLVDRILDCRGEGSNSELLVKWKSLGYDEVTWENKRLLIAKVDNANEKMEMFNEINSKDTLKLAQKPCVRPSSKSYPKNNLELPKFRNDNQLKDYQVEGVTWLVYCWYNKRNSILADEMGLGKTIQAIGAIQYLHTIQNFYGPFLVVAPMGTIEQWKREVEEWTELNAIIYHGSAEARKLIEDTEWYFGENTKRSKIYKFNVLITTFEVALAESTKLQSIPWQYMVIDEAHRIKNNESKLFQTLMRYKTAHKLLLTGTPLQNGVKELWTLLHFLDSKKFDDLDTFLEDFGDLKEASQVSELHKKLGPYLLRRVKSDVALFIPKKEETLVEIELTSTQKTFYKAILERNKQFLTKSAAKSSLMNIMMQLRKCCNHPYLIRGAEESITKGIKKKDEAGFFEKLVRSSSKFIFIDKLLGRLRESKHRVLIFSQMTKVLNLLEQYMKLKSYPYERLDGGVSRTDRQAAIDRFSDANRDSFVFLLGTRAGGVGINLTIADTVILFDSDWNPQNDIQAQARCHRIGQENTVKIYRLITRNTYEKKMFLVASKKLGLDHAVLGKKSQEEEEAGAISGMDKEQIEKMLKFGAYSLFSQGEDKQAKTDEFDLDSILQRATTVDYNDANSNNIAGGLGSFSKATFVANEEDNVDMDDAMFWEKVLPSFKTASKLAKVIQDPAALDTEEKRTNFLADLAAVVQTVEEQREEASHRVSNFDPTAELLTLLRRLYGLKVWTAENLATIKNWISEAEKPRLRKRQPKDAKKKASKEVDENGEDEEKEDLKDMDVEEPEAKPSKPSKKKKASAPVEFVSEWPKAMRDRVKAALLLYGFGRWEEVFGNTKLGNKDHLECICFTESLLEQLLTVRSPPERKDTPADGTEAAPKPEGPFTPYALPFVKRAIEWTGQEATRKIAEYLQTEKKATSKDKQEFKCTLAATNAVAASSLSIQLSEDLSKIAESIFLQITLEVDGNSTVIRFLKVNSEDIKQRDLPFFVPGFSGTHHVALGVLDSRGSFVERTRLKPITVEPHPVLLASAGFDAKSTAIQTWENRLALMDTLQTIYRACNGQWDEVRIPTLSIKTPAPWWKKKDDRKLLQGTFDFGYGRYEAMIAEDSYNWNAQTRGEEYAEKKMQEEKLSEKPEAVTVFPSSTALNTRLKRLVYDTLRAVQRREAKEEDLKRKATSGEESVDAKKSKNV